VPVLVGTPIPATAGNAALSFVPNANWNGSTSLVFSATDAEGASSPAVTQGISVAAVNDAPVGADRSLTIAEGATYSLGRSDFGFSDPADPTPNNFASVTVSPASAGTLTLNGVAVSAATVVTVAQLDAGLLQFTPAPSTGGVAYAALQFQVRDDGGTGNGGADTDVTPNTLTFDVSVVNDTPVNTTPATLSVLEDTLTAVTGVSVTDADDASGPASNQLATVQLSVSNGTLQLVLTGTAGISAGSIGSGGLTLSGSQADINASLASLQYQGNANYVGGDTLVVISRDGLGLTDSDTVAITVGPVNDEPSGQDATRTLLEDGSYTFNRGDFGFSDAPGEGNNFVSVTVNAPSAGSLTLGGVPVTAATTVLVGQLDSGALVFLPAAHAHGSGYASVGFAVKDDGGTASGGADTDATPNTITFNVTPANDAPVAVADTASLNENGYIASTVLTSVLANDTDADAGDTREVTAVSFGGTPGTLNGATPGLYGTFLLYADGSYEYATNRPAADALALNQTVTETFTYSMRDAAGATSSTTVTFTITGTDDTPVISVGSGSVIENTQPSTSGTLTAADSDNPALSFSGGTVSGAYGSLVLAANGAWTYTLDARAEALAGGQVVNDPIAVMLSDGSTTTVTLSITGTNDAAVINSATVGLPETNAVLSTGGTLTVSDIDSPATFVAQAATIGAYGTFAIDAAGVWTYTATSAHNEFVAGTTYTDTFTVASVDGTTSTVTVNIAGTNDAAIITAGTGSVTEDAGVIAGVISTGGTLAITDADSGEAAFQAQPAVAGAFGIFTLAATGIWTYSVANGNPAVQALGAGQTLTDTFAVRSVDGTLSSVTVTINGANDAAVLSSVTANLTETNAVLSTGGTLTISDIDGPATFVAQAATAGAYGTFAINSGGVWNYTASSAHNEFVAGTTYTDTFTVASADGTTSTVTVNLAGSNDAAVLSSATVNLTETNAVLSTGGTLTVSDVDSPATFVAQAATVGAYGTFAINAAGAWTYTASSAHNEFAAGTTYTDTFTVASADGTTSSVTVNIGGTNDAAVLSSATVNLAETNAVLSTGGTLTVSDVDSPANFVAQAATVGAYGTFAINTAGVWTYTASSAHNEFVAGTTYSETFNVASADGTASTVTVNIAGTNDAPTITGAQIGSVKEDTTLTSTGTLTVTDPDAGQSSFVAQAATAGTYGSFAITAAGAWTYTLANAAANVQSLGATSALFDTFTVTTIDGTARGVVIAINGTNDAPVAVADSAVAFEDTALNVSAAAGVLANDSDIDSGSTLSVSSFTWGGTTYAAGASATLAGVGTLQLNADGSYAFTPAANRAGALPSVSYAVSDGIASTSSTLSLNVTAVADAPVLTLNGTSITGGTSTTTLPAATGLALAFYDNIAAVSAANAGTISVVETGVESSAATSNSVASDVAIASIGVDDAYRYTGFIYLAAGQTYTVAGSRDDTLMVKIGGNSVYSVGYNNWGAFTASTFTPTSSGYYSIEVIAYNGDGVGDLDLGLSVNGAAAVDLSTANFRLYASASTLTGSGTVVGAFVPNSDGGYYGTTIKGNEDGAIALGNIAASLTDADGSETLAVRISAIPVGATLTDGANSFTATAGSTSVAVTGWNLNAITLTPPTNASGTINLTVTATATESTGVSASSSGTLVVTVTPVADTPALAVSNVLVALAQGSGAASTIHFPIMSTLVDTDGSEALSFIVSGVPTTATFNHGTNLGGGTWSFVASDLSDLDLTLPAGYTTTGTTLTVTSTATESGNGASAGSSATLTLISDYTTTSYTGTAAADTRNGGGNNDYINGAGGNDTLSGNNGNDIILGGAGTDSINGGSGSDALSGEAANDIIVGGTGSDRISGGTGNDTLTGGTGVGADSTVDVFTWTLADAGSAGTPAVDTITDFNTAAANSGGDVLDLRDLLSGDVLGTGNTVGNLANYLDFDTTTTPGSTIVHISSSGGFTNGTYTTGAEDERIMLTGVDLRTGMGLVSTATDAQIIQELLTRGKLITDSP
jgi:VCBS repeat-containing protein